MSGSRIQHWRSPVRCRRSLAALPLLFLLLSPAPDAAAQESFTLYELLEPGSHRFAITYDVTTRRAGARFYLNGIRRGAVATDERVLDLATGEELRLEVISGADAKAEGLRGESTPDDARYIKIWLPEPVPENGEARLRIIKTYEDPESYWSEGDRVVFERDLGIRANAVVLPPGFELVACEVPAIVSTLDDGRVKASFLNDRDDSLAVRIVGRRTGPEAGR